jgi:hypothetical protein
MAARRGPQQFSAPSLLSPFFSSRAIHQRLAGAGAGEITQALIRMHASLACQRARWTAWYATRPDQRALPPPTPAGL